MQNFVERFMIEAQKLWVVKILIEKFDNYIRNEKNLSLNTAYNYISDIQKFKEFVKKDLTKVDRKDIENYISFLRDSGMSVVTTNRKLASLKSFYKYLCREEYIVNNPALLVESGKTERKLPRPLSVSDINKISNATKSLRDKAIIETLYGAGLRRVELINLKKNHVNWKKGVLYIKGKGKKNRLVPLNGYALSLLKQYCDSHDSEWVFPSKKGGNLSARRLNEIIEYYAKKAKVPNATPHKFRHSFGTHLYGKGMDSKVLQDLMGHESINTTSVYAKVSIERNLIEYNKYFDREETLKTY